MQNKYNSNLANYKGKKVLKTTDLWKKLNIDLN